MAKFLPHDVISKPRARHFTLLIAIGLLTGLVSVSKRINHRMALAHYLKERGDSANAKSELDQALRDFATQPDFVQRRDRRWADRARKLLAEMN